MGWASDRTQGGHVDGRNDDWTTDDVLRITLYTERESTADDIKKSRSTAELTHQWHPPSSAHHNPKHQ